MVKVWLALVSVPPLAVPPVSWMWMVTVAVPFWLAAGVKFRTPVADTAGWALNSVLLSLVATKSTVWADSFGPAVMLIAQPMTVWAPASSFAVWFAPLVNDGASFT